MNDFLTVNEAAEKLKVTPSRVRHFIDEDRFDPPAEWDSRLHRWTIPPSAISSFQRIKRPTGKHLKK